MDRIDALRLFGRVAERQSFSAAAADLKIKQSTASKWIAGLELELGVRLVERTTRSVRLTDAGRTFLDRSEALVAACRYPPVGRRGFGPRRASGYRREIKAYEARANDAIFVMPQIEDVATLDVIEDFVAVPGIDAVAIGPNDMSGTAGVFRDPGHPIIRAAMERIARTAAARGLASFTGVNTAPGEIAALVEMGFRIQTIASDTDLMIAGAEAAFAANRAALAKG